MNSEALPKARESRARSYVVLGLATLLAASVEGAIAAYAAWERGLRVPDFVLAYFATNTLVWLGALVPVAALATFSTLPGVRSFAAGLREAFGDTARLVIALSLSFTASLALAGRASTILQSLMSAAFAAGALAALSLFAFAFSLFGLGAIFASGLATGLASGRTQERIRWHALGPFVAALVASGGMALALRAFPLPYVLAPVAWVAAIVVLSHERVPGLVQRLRRPVLAALAIMLAGSVVTAWTWQRPGHASETSALVRGAPWAGQALGLVWSISDHDRDGFSPLLGGGDCDDRDAKRNPDARDVPANGIDENCSGADAPKYKPLAPPPSPKQLALPARPNFLLLQLDALRPDHLSFAGYGRPTSPALDRLAQRSVWFRNAYTTAPSTRFAMTSAFTGYDTRRVPHQRLGGNRFQLDSEATTVAERLSKRGYQTKGFTISYVLQHNKGLGQGFTHWDTPWPVEEWERTYGTAAELTSAAVIDTLKQTPDDSEKPFLLFAHYRCTHDPYIKYERWDYGDRPIDVYDSALNYCDSEIEKVLKEVEQRGDADRTVIVVFSDHGELFGEHGSTNHGNTVYEPDVRILLMAAIPGIAHRVIDDPVSLADVAPTLLALAGVSGPTDTEGWSLLSYLGDSAPIPPRPLFMFTDLWRGQLRYQSSAVVRWPYKYVIDKASRREALFDVQRDPQENRDLSRTKSVLMRELGDLNDAYEAFAEGNKADPRGRKLR